MTDNKLKFLGVPCFRYTPRCLLLVGGMLALAARLPAAEPVVVTGPAAEATVQKIWDAAPHNAFTDLIRFRDRWFCVFREGQGHVSPDGALQVLTSSDGQQWESAARLTAADGDLRDAKISITPEGKLMLSGASAVHPPSEVRHQSLAWYSDDGRDWSEPVKIGEPNFWLWRVTWHKGLGWGVGYATAGPRIARLYRSEDDRNFQVWNENLFDEGYPNESSILFLDDQTGWCLLRRDGQPNQALLGSARPPYKEWEWRELPIRIGGPHMIRLPDGRILVAGRSYEGGARTRLWEVDLEKAELTELLLLPSGGDTSYPGLVWHDDQLWMSYYSSHEGKTSIYLAQIRLKPLAP